MLKYISGNIWNFRIFISIIITAFSKLIPSEYIFMVSTLNLKFSSFHIYIDNYFFFIFFLFLAMRKKKQNREIVKMWFLKFLHNKNQAHNKSRTFYFDQINKKKNIYIINLLTFKISHFHFYFFTSRTFIFSASLVSHFSFLDFLWLPSALHF